MALWEVGSAPLEAPAKASAGHSELSTHCGGLPQGDERLPLPAWALLWTLQSGGALGRTKRLCQAGGAVSAAAGAGSRMAQARWDGHRSPLQSP